MGLASVAAAPSAFGGKTASEDMRAAVRQGVREGLSSEGGGAGRSFGSIEVPVYLDGEEVGRGIARANKRTNTRTNPRSSLGMAY